MEERQTRKARALFLAGSSEICPYRACNPTDPKFIPQVTRAAGICERHLVDSAILGIVSGRDGPYVSSDFFAPILTCGERYAISGTGH